MRTRVLFVGLFAAMGVPAVISSPAEKLIRLLESRYSHAGTLGVVFCETYQEDGRTIRAESGKAWFRRPGKMRWEYEAPETKLFVSDGHTIWFYVPGDRTALRSHAKDSADWRTPFLLLTRNPKIKDLCERVSLGVPGEAATPGHQLLHCEPRGPAKEASKTRKGPGSESSPGGGNEEILLEIDPATGDLGRVLIREAGGVGLEFRFSKWEWNPALPDSEFLFHPPAGVAIVDGQPPQ